MQSMAKFSECFKANPLTCVSYKNLMSQLPHSHNLFTQTRLKDKNRRGQNKERIRYKHEKYLKKANYNIKNKNYLFLKPFTQNSTQKKTGSIILCNTSGKGSPIHGDEAKQRRDPNTQ